MGARVKRKLLGTSKPSCSSVAWKSVPQIPQRFTAMATWPAPGAGSSTDAMLRGYPASEIRLPACCYLLLFAY